MTTGKNPAASVKARLLNLAHAQKADFQQLLMRYALERLLYRLEQSPYQERFVLKGAMLFHIWLDQQDLRVTKDLDLLSFGYNSPEKLKEVFAEICRLEPSEADGIRFDVDKLEAIKIKCLLQSRRRCVQGTYAAAFALPKKAKSMRAFV